MRKKAVIGIAAGAVMLAGAASGVAIAETGSSTATGYAACIASGNKLKNNQVFPVSRLKAGNCKANETYYSWPSLAGMQKAIAAAVAEIPGGHDGTDGVSGYDIVQGEASTIAAGAFGGSAASCPDGKVSIGGGYDGGDGLQVTTNGPSAFGVDPETGLGGSFGWDVLATNTGTASVTVQAYAVCMAAPTAQ